MLPPQNSENLTHFNQTAASTVMANMTSYNYTHPFNETDIILTATFIFIFMAFGMFANVLTIAVIISSKKLNAIFHYFILSLCVSDTISALISWINLYRRTWGFDNFAMPDFICVFYWGVDIWTSYVTALHILSFAILRLIGVKWPDKLNTIKRATRNGLIWIVIIWIIAFVSGGVPMGLFSWARPKDRSASTPDSKWPACTQLSEWLQTYGVYTNFAYSIFFYVPIVSIIVVSLLIAVVMVKKGQVVALHMSDVAAYNRRTKEKQAMAQLAMIIGSFLIGYVPFTAFEFHTFQQKNVSAETLWIDWHFGTAQYLCLRFSECLNPILYNLGSRKMWMETKLFWAKTFGCGTAPVDARRSTNSATGTGFNESGIPTIS